MTFLINENDCEFYRREQHKASSAIHETVEYFPNSRNLLLTVERSKSSQPLFYSTHWMETFWIMFWEKKFRCQTRTKIPDFLQNNTWSNG